MISAVAEFIVVVPALWNSPSRVTNQLPLHREGGQGGQNHSRKLSSPKEKMHLAPAQLGTGESLIPELCLLLQTGINPGKRAVGAVGK